MALGIGSGCWGVWVLGLWVLGVWVLRLGLGLGLGIGSGYVSWLRVCGRWVCRLAMSERVMHRCTLRSIQVQISDSMFMTTFLKPYNFSLLIHEIS